MELNRSSSDMAIDFLSAAALTGNNIHAVSVVPFLKSGDSSARSESAGSSGAASR